MLLSILFLFPRVAGLHFCKPLLLACSHSGPRNGSFAAGIVNEIESVTSVWRLGPAQREARGTPAREVRRLEDVLIVPSFPVETQAGLLLLR